MSYPDLQHEVAQRVRPPAFEHVLARAADARRRRRTTIGASLAAVVVVGGLAVAVGAPRGGERSEPAAPSRTGSWDGASEVDARLPAEVQEVLRADNLHLWSVNGSEGSMAAVWRACGDDERRCRAALVIQQDGDVHGSVLRGATPMLTPLQDGWFLEDDDRLVRLARAGERRAVVGTDDVASVMEAGDTSVHVVGDAFPHRGDRVLRGTELLGVPVPEGATVRGTYATPAGRMVTAVATVTDRFQVTLLDPAAGSFREPEEQPSQTEYLDQTGRSSGHSMYGYGDRVVLASYGDVADGSISLLAVEVSHDAGETWTAATGLGLGVDGESQVRDVSGVAVSDAGTTYLTTESHGLVRVERDGSTTASRLSSQDTSVFTDGFRVCLVAEAGKVDHLQCSSDDGATWEPAPLPGFR